MEHHNVVDTVEEFGAEVLLQLVIDLILHALILAVSIMLANRTEAHAHSLGDVLGTKVGGEDQDRVLEIDNAALTVGKPAVFQHLEEGVVDFLVGLLNLVEKHHGERLTPHLFGKLAALFVANIAGGRTEQAGGGEPVVELAHVDLDQGVILTKQEVRKRFRKLGFTHTGGAGENKRTGGTPRILQTGAGTANRPRHCLDRILLTNNALMQLILHIEQTGGLFLGELEHGNPGPVGQHLGDLLLAHLGNVIKLPGAPLLFLLAALLGQLALLVTQPGGLFEILCVNGGLFLPPHLGNPLIHFPNALGGGHAFDTHASAGLVDEVDSLIRQEPVVDVPVGQVRGGGQGTIGDRHPVVGFIPVPQALQNVDRQFHGGLGHLHRLEPTLQGGVLFNVLAVLVKGGGTNGLQLTTGQLGL